MADDNAADDPTSPPANELLRRANEQLIFATMRAEAATKKAEAAGAAAQADRAALEEEAELREQLMGIVGHDLRNPIASIVMSARLLQTGAEKDEGRRAEILAGIELSAARMRDLIEHLLDFTRAHGPGGLAVRPQPANLERICRAVVAELEVGRNLPGQFSCEFHGDLTGSWDPARLAQVASNIAGNALEHSAPGAPVRVRATASISEVVLDIINQGETLPPERLRQLFLPFRRAEPAQGPRAVNSTGLGLYIARELVRAHGGKIEVTSTPAEGTCFRTTLPRRVPTND